MLRTDRDNLQSLMIFKYMPSFAFAVALAIRGRSLLCYVNTVETLTFRDSGKCVFFSLSVRMAVWKTFSIFLTNLDVDGTVLLDLLEVDGTGIFPEDYFIETLSITPQPAYCKLCENRQL